MGVVSAGHECVGGTHGSGNVYRAADVLGMSVVRGMREVGGVCEMCMCLARDGVVVVVCHDHVRRQVSQGSCCRGS